MPFTRVDEPIETALFVSCLFPVTQEVLSIGV